MAVKSRHFSKDQLHQNTGENFQENLENFVGFSLRSIKILFRSFSKTTKKCGPKRRFWALYEKILTIKSRFLARCSLSKL